MSGSFGTNRAEVTASTRKKIVTIYAVLIGANVLVWALAFVFFSPPHALLLGTALLAFTFGLRHAVDADHISAIDNVTRKLMQDGKQPVGVGFYFSLGHSTIVFLLTLAIAVGASALRSRLPQLEAFGGIFGTGISAGFLLLIAAVNTLVLVDLLRALRSVRAGEQYCEQSLNDMLNDRGLLGRFFKPLLRLVSRSRDMYLVGFLFGLGFDTATEVGVLGIAAIEAGKGLPIWTILLLPAAVRSGDVARRHDRRNPHAGRVRLGVSQSRAQAVLQRRGYDRVGVDRRRRRRHRTLEPRRRRLTDWLAGLRRRRDVCGGLGRLDGLLRSTGQRRKQTLRLNGTRAFERSSALRAEPRLQVIHVRAAE